MNWDAIGAIGEILGATAVVVSLVYVAMQIRLNTKETKMQRTQSLISANSDVNSLMAGSKELADIFQASVLDYDELSGSDKMRFGALSFSAFNRYSFAYHQYLSDELEEAFWALIEREMLVFLNLPGARAWWEKDKARFLPEFVSHMDELLKRTGDDFPDLDFSFTVPPA